MIKVHSESERENPLPPLHGLLFPIGGGGGGELFKRPYPLKVQACPLRDRRPATRSKVSGQGD